ncbi:MAG: hypothetical protein ACOZAM_15110 [Pseudomonadota bacterium]
MKFKVLRQHLGDKLYMPGDIREISEADAGHLVKLGCLAKADAPVDNAAEDAAPANKAEDAAPQNKKSGKRKAADA